MRGAFNPRPIADQFWARAGVAEDFPRRLTPTIAAILPVPVILLPRLTIPAVVDWLGRHRVPCTPLSGSRRLRGCLVAQRGHGFMFVEGDLAEDEQRLTVAHETAHFLYHYEQPRALAYRLLGESILGVLDGDRAPTPSERLRGALRGVPVGVYTHTLDRDDDGRPNDEAARLETEADLIAFELLAPMATVRRSTGGRDYANVLVSRFGLPTWAAVRWGAWIGARSSGDGFIARLSEASKSGRRALSRFAGDSGSPGKKLT
jgi:hypothetical protein